VVSNGHYYRHPPVKWAQRKDQLLLTIDVSDVENSKIEITESGLSFSGRGGSDKRDYQVLPRAIYFHIKKKEEGPFWPRLLKNAQKHPFIRTDFNQWVDEDEQDGSIGNRPDFGDMGDFGGFPGGQNFDMMGGDDDDEYPQDEMPAMSSSEDEHESEHAEDEPEEEGSTSKAHEL
jgi:prostaglandin-E synthase